MGCGVGGWGAGNINGGAEGTKMTRETGKKSRGNYGSQERMEREVLREDGRGGVWGLLSAAKTRKVRGSWKERWKFGKMGGQLTG